MTRMAAVAAIDVEAPLFNHQVLAQVASINVNQTKLTGLKSSATIHLIKYKRGKRTIQSRSTMCQ